MVPKSCLLCYALIDVFLVGSSVAKFQLQPNRVLIQSAVGDTNITDHDFIRCNLEAFVQVFPPLEASEPNHIFDLEDINVDEGVVIELEPPFHDESHIDNAIVYHYTINVAACGNRQEDNLSPNNSINSAIQYRYEAWPSSISFNIDFLDSFNHQVPSASSGGEIFDHKFIFQLLPIPLHDTTIDNDTVNAYLRDWQERPKNSKWRFRFQTGLSVVTLSLLPLWFLFCCDHSYTLYPTSDSWSPSTETNLPKEEADDNLSVHASVQEYVETQSFPFMRYADFNDEDDYFSRCGGELSPKQFSCDTLSSLDDSSAMTEDDKTSTTVGTCAVISTPPPRWNRKSASDDKLQLGSSNGGISVEQELEDLLSYIPDLSSGGTDVAAASPSVGGSDSSVDWLVAVMDRVLLVSEDDHHSASGGTTTTGIGTTADRPADASSTVLKPRITSRASSLSSTKLQVPPKAVTVTCLCPPHCQSSPQLVEHSKNSQPLQQQPQQQQQQQQHQQQPLTPLQWKSADDIPKMNRKPFTESDHRRLRPPEESERQAFQSSATDDDNDADNTEEDEGRSDSPVTLLNTTWSF